MLVGENDLARVDADVADIVTAEGLTLDDAKRNALSRELIKTNITLLRIQKARVAGDHETERGRPAPQSTTLARPSAPQATGLKLSQLANKYVYFKTQNTR